jgi:hypothetical protein
MTTTELIDLLYEAATEIRNYSDGRNIVAIRLVEAAKELEANQQ